ncbi:evolutionarily conserved signaling intermediate in Toll pathway, mitochondrial [Athalia rosae]|uniref:evolutionarily conserved signaling intermediate in Toll pathway, mitochondrial n=1 Tax=Athalia rosae TaxID=37344 RepID=UPI0020336A7E|nr:evolutionarily conserved signaling intermediate in Toll pathway, mitochondrial [Athalia rosae]
MTSIIRKSCIFIRSYPWVNGISILHNVKESMPEITRFISNTNMYQSKDENSKVGTSALEIYGFAQVKSKKKESFIEVLRMYESRDKYRRGHVEFIYSAMQHMQDFGVHKDLDAYKKLLDVLPKGKFIPSNRMQAEFMHYPKQQQCAIDVLCQMEDNGVIPDWEMEDQLLNIFGKWGYPLRKFWRMMYWMPKFKNASPWPLPQVLPNDPLELAKLAIDRITSVDVRRKITVFQSEDLPDSIDKTWIVSSISPDQKILLEKHPPNTPIYVEGPFRVWLKDCPLNYFILRGDRIEKPQPKPTDDDDVSNIDLPIWKSPSSKALTVDETVHEQEDGTIFSVCATGTSSRDSLLSWVRCLQEENSALANIPVLFTLKSPLGEVALSESDSIKDVKKIEVESNSKEE